MNNQGRVPKTLESNDIRNANTVWWNLSTPMLYEHAVRRYEGLVAHLGPLVVRTGQYTGRSPKDRYLVREPSSEERIWWGKENQPIEQENYTKLRARLRAYLQGKDLYVQDCFVCNGEQFRTPIRVINELAWQSIFARNMFVRELDRAKLAKHTPEFTVIAAPGFQAWPEEDGTHSEAFVILNFGRKEVLIGGTSYAGEIKKAIFTTMNYFLPLQDVLSMHCSANYGKDRDDVAIFFGLSGTGKTSVSTDTTRTLIGDDEHGWSEDGVFNLEGGCYAKMIRLSARGEPEIYATTRRFGTVLENVAIDSITRKINLDSDEFTENTRGSYPISHLPNAAPDGTGGHPKHIVMLTADAFGVLPPISRLTPEQATYHFLSGYTAKVAGTERGITEPKAVFSACFGAPFMAQRPAVYAELLRKKMQQHHVRVWLVNTGWSGGAYGKGSRIKLEYTRAMVRAALNGELDDVATRTDKNFGIEVPESCPDVPSEVLNPRETWDDPKAYDEQAQRLVGMFVENFAQFKNDLPAEVRNARPQSV